MEHKLKTEDFKPIYQRDLKTITNSDLGLLFSVEEGWFIEFKSHVPDGRKLAKSISSFSNSYGGLLVIGAQENAKTRKLEKFSPVSAEEANSIEIKVREAANSYLTPCPFFSTKAIEIPEIDEGENCRWIVLVNIPKGEMPPYLHGDGVIFTRKGDSSSPISLTDHGLLEKLWSETRNKKEELKNRINYLCSQGNKKIPRIELIIKVKRKPTKEIKKITYSDFLSAVKTPFSVGGEAIFNNTYTIDTSYVARRPHENLKTTGMLWEYDYKRNIHYINLPLAAHAFSDEGMDQSKVGYDQLTALEEHLLEKHNGENSFIVDITISMVLICHIIYLIKKLHFDAGDITELLLNARAAALKECFIFLNTPRYEDSLKKNGAPFIYRESDFVYPLDDVAVWKKIDLEEAEGIEETEEIDADAERNKVTINCDIVNGINFFLDICNSAGIPDAILHGHELTEGIKINYDEIVNAFSKIASGKISFSVAENQSIE